MTVKNFVLYLFILSCILLIFVVYWRQFSNSEHENNFQTAEALPKASTKHLEQCKEGYFFSQIDNSCLPCEKGSFSFMSWIGCHPWLDCTDIETNVRTRGLLSTASHINAVKSIYLADWHGYTVVYMKCSSALYWDDCRHNTRMIKGLQGSELVVQLLGTCEEKQEMVTSYYHHGSADKLNQVLPLLHLHKEELNVRIQLARDYLRILVFLHNSPLGVRVMCDTNYLIKTLSQFLITDDLHLVVNDLDALPEVDRQLGQLVKCGHRELYGWFVAPEQLWPFDDKPFNDLEMPGYDEKIDIWRIPNVVIWFLGDSLDGLRIKAKLKYLFTSCKAVDPKLRPSASEVLKRFEENVS